MKKNAPIPYKSRLVLVAVACLLLVQLVTVICVFHSHRAIEALSASAWRLEPETPQDIGDPPFAINPPSHVLPVRDVMDGGTEIPLRFAYDDPEWERQAYKAYWHSSYGRWSYMPLRLYYAMHRLFAAYPTASLWYDFTHDLGIVQESEAFKLPGGDPFKTLVIVVMDTKVEKIMARGNQIAIVGRPSPTGLQVLTVDTDQIKPDSPDKDILFQLVTPDGDEIDRTYEPYAAQERRPGYAQSLTMVWSQFFR